MQTGKYIVAMVAMLAFTGAYQAHANEGGKDRNQQVMTKGVENSSANMVLVGELVDTRDVTLKGVDEEKHRLLKVKAGDDSQTVIVDIGRQDSAASFGLMKGDRVIAVGKSARINERPVLFAKSIGELYPVGRVGSVARDAKQMKQDTSARGAAAMGTSAKDGKKQSAKRDSTDDGAAGIDVPDARNVDEVVVWFDTDNLGTDQYGTYDRDFVWVTVDPDYSSWNPANTSLAWNDNWETPHWDVWGYDDADEWGLFDW